MTKRLTQDICFRSDVIQSFVIFVIDLILGVTSAILQDLLESLLKNVSSVRV